MKERLFIVCFCLASEKKWNLPRVSPLGRGEVKRVGGASARRAFSRSRARRA
jgi:hypothetical protein